MKFTLGLLSGLVVATLSLFFGMSYFFTDYLAQEKIVPSEDLGASLQAFSDFFQELEKYPEHKAVDLCERICAPSDYQFMVGRKAVRKVESLRYYLQQHRKKSFKDPEFLLDLVYVQGSMTPLRGSGLFEFLTSLPLSSAGWPEKILLSSSLAMTSPRILFAMKDANENDRKLRSLRQLRDSCKSTEETEIVQQCHQLTRGW